MDWKRDVPLAWLVKDVWYRIAILGKDHTKGDQ